MSDVLTVRLDTSKLDVVAEFLAAVKQGTLDEWCETAVRVIDDTVTHDRIAPGSIGSMHLMSNAIQAHHLSTSALDAIVAEVVRLGRFRNA